MTMVDLEDTEEVLDVVMDRMLEVQIDEELPVYVIPIRPMGSKFVTRTQERGVASQETSLV